MAKTIINGTEGRDVLYGGAADEIINGGGGNDDLYGYGGDNELSGGAGDDYLLTYSGDDIMDGGDGNDRIESFGGNDLITGGAGNDRLTTSVAASDAGFQRVDMGEGDDTVELNGGRFADGAALNGGAGVDTLRLNGAILHRFTAASAESGWERLDARTQGSVTGTAAGDHLDFDALALVGGTNGLTISTLGGDDNVGGSAGADRIYGGEGNDTVAGNKGDDYVTGDAGNDYLEGGEGADTMYGNGDDDTLYGDAGDDWLYGGQGENKLLGGTGVDRLFGGEHSNYLDGGDCDDIIESSAFRADLAKDEGDVIFGGAGNDTIRLTSGSGVQYINGGKGYDVVELGSARFHQIDFHNVELLRVDLAMEGSQIGDRIDLSGVAIHDALPNDGKAAGVKVNGNGGNDLLIGSNGNDTMWGGDDDDVLEGWLGDDVLQGHFGFDIASYAHAATGVTVSLAEQDKAQATGAGVDTLQGMEGLRGSAHADVLTGDANHNLLQGGAGNDTLHGGFGGDRLEGGDGDDVIHAGGRAYNTQYGSAQPPADAYKPEQLIGGAGADSYVFSDAYAWGSWTHNQSFWTGPQEGQNSNAFWTYTYTPQGLQTPTEVEFNAGEGDRLVFDGFAQPIARVASEVGSEGRISYAVVGGHTEVYLRGIVFAGGVNAEAKDGVVGKLVLSGKVDIRQAAPGSTSYVGLDIVEGGAGSDTLAGGVGPQSLYGFAGDDWLEGGAGDDWIDGGEGVDTASYGGASGGVTVSLAAQGQDQNTGTGGVDRLVGIENLRGSAHADVLIGSSDANVIEGGEGDDVIEGGRGADRLDGGMGADTYRYRSVEDLSPGGASATIERVKLDETDRIDFGAFLHGSQFIGVEGFSGSGAPEIRAAAQGTDTLVEIDANGDGVADGRLLVEGRVALSLLADAVLGRTQWNDITGSVRNDTLRGAGAGDRIRGLEGNDRLYGLGGADLLAGGDGNDLLDGGAGADRMEGGAGNDGYFVDDAGDQVVESAGGGVDGVTATVDHALAAEVENLTLAGTAVRGWGNALANTIGGNAGANVIDAGDGADRVRGLAGDDLILGGGGADRLDGDEGADRLDGGDGGDTLYGGADADTLDGGAGDDRLDGGAGADVLRGGDGSDTYVVDALDVVEELGAGGVDHVVAGFDYALTANVENLTLTGAAVQGNGNALGNTLVGNDANNRLFGLAGDDLLNGGAGNDLLDGGAGDDRMTGGLGDDVYRVDSAKDVVSERAGQGHDTVGAFCDYTLAANVEDAFLYLDGAFSLRGNALDNTLTALDGANRLWGGAGNDTIRAGGGDDWLYGEAGADQLHGEAGNDRFVFAKASDANGDMLDWNAGDLIDLAAIDANTLVRGDQAFAWIGGAAFTGVAGQLRAWMVDARTFVAGDTNGDGAADFTLSVGHWSIGAGDILL